MNEPMKIYECYTCICIGGESECCRMFTGDTYVSCIWKNNIKKGNGETNE